MANLASSVAANAVSIGQAMKAANDNADTLTKGIAAIPNALRAALVAFVAFEAVKFVFGQVSDAAERARERVEALVKVASQAQSAGVGTTFFQGWTLQAKDLNTEVSTLTAMLEKAREASTTRLGEGKDATSPIQERLSEHVQAGNITQAGADRFANAQDQEARIRVILDLVDELRKRGADLAAFDLGNKMFGPNFEAMLRNGVDAIGKMRAALDGLRTAGGERIITPEEVENARRINETMKETQRVMADALAPIQRDLALWSQQQAASWAEMQLTMARAAATILSIYDVLVSIGGQLERLGNSPFWARITEAAKAWGLFGNFGGTGKLEEAPPGGFRDENGQPLPVINVRPGRDTSRALPSRSTRSAGSEDNSLDAVERFIQQQEKSQKTLQAELDTLGKGNVERQRALDLAKAQAAAEQDFKEKKRDSATLTDDETSRVLKLADANAKLKDRILDVSQAQRQAAEATRYFGDLAANALGDMIFNGAKAADVLRNLASQLGRAGLQSLLTGQGPLAGLLGTAPAASAGSNAVGGLFGWISSAFKAGGGDVQAGRAYTVGELGTELFIPKQNGRVVPIERGGFGGAAMGGMALSMGDTIIDARGAQIGVATQIAAAMAAHRRDLERNIGDMMAQWSARYRGA